MGFLDAHINRRGKDVIANDNDDFLLVINPDSARRGPRPDSSGWANTWPWLLPGAPEISSRSVDSRMFELTPATYLEHTGSGRMIDSYGQG